MTSPMTLGVSNSYERARMSELGRNSAEVETDWFKGGESAEVGRGERDFGENVAESLSSACGGFLREE